MAITSFNKDFTLRTKKEVDSFINIVNTSVDSIKISKNLLTKEREKQGEQKVRQMLKGK